MQKIKVKNINYLRRFLKKITIPFVKKNLYKKIVSIFGISNENNIKISHKK